MLTKHGINYGKVLSTVIETAELVDFDDEGQVRGADAISGGAMRILKCLKLGAKIYPSLWVECEISKLTYIDDEDEDESDDEEKQDWQCFNCFDKCFIRQFNAAYCEYCPVCDSPKPHEQLLEVSMSHFKFAAWFLRTFVIASDVGINYSHMPDRYKIGYIAPISFAYGNALQQSDKAPQQSDIAPQQRRAATVTVVTL